MCGCGRRRGVQLHHVVYRQEIRRVVRDDHHMAPGYLAGGPPDVTRELTLLADQRNLVPVGPKCHAAHHNRDRPLAIRLLPDCAFEFAEELLGAGRAYEYLSRRYSGRDPRLDVLLARSAA